MAKHHIVQEKYLRQWAKLNSTNALQMYLIPTNKYVVKNTKWPGFYKKNYNILDDNDDRYLPEQITNIIDTKGIEAIRSINCHKQNQLTGAIRSALAFYTALQYIRTPRYRDEEDAWIDAGIKNAIKNGVGSIENIRISKKELLRRKPSNKKEELILAQIEKMGQKEINKKISEWLEEFKNDNSKIILTKSGHSKKMIDNIGLLAKGVFDSEWNILFTNSNATFDTSDNPCFAISDLGIMQGLLSRYSKIIFPLRPDICLWIQPKNKSQTELYTELPEMHIANINKQILLNSYQCVISKNKNYLEKLTETYDYNNHCKSRGVVTKNFSKKTKTNLE